MVIAVIVLLAVGAGLCMFGMCYEPEKPKKKLPDWVVAADDGDDE